MYPFDIIFNLNTTHQSIVVLEITLEKPFHEMSCYCQTEISFYDGDQHYLLNVYDSLTISMESLVCKLTKALDNKLPLNVSITKNIGLLYNEYQKNIYDDKGNNEKRLAEMYAQLSQLADYEVWCHKQWIAFMYNDAQGNIIFQITPRYPAFFVKEEELATISSYEEWVQSYQPVFTAFISKEVAQQWLQQANNILTDIYKKQGNDQEGSMIYEPCSHN